MSHATGAVRFESDGLILYFEYNGTSDIAKPALMDTYDEAWDHLRHGYALDLAEDPNGKCPHFGSNQRAMACQHPKEVIELCTEYGEGFHWPGEACRLCRVITKGHIPHGPMGRHEPEWTRTNGYPDWWPRRRRNE